VVALPPLVDSVIVHREDVTEWLVGYGSALPDRSANLAAEVAATVVERVNDLEAGSTVQEGEPLIRLDDREYRHALDRARALAAVDQATIDELAAEAGALQGLRTTAEHELRVTANEKRRVADLFERNLAAKKEFDFANLAYQQARRILQGFEMQLARIGPRQERSEASRRSREAEAELAELNIKRCEISAPFSGAIQALLVDEGDRVGPGSPLLTLIDPSHVEIPIQLPASVYAHVAPGAPCRLRCESMPGIAWQGQVERISPLVDERTRTFSVYLDVDNTTQSQPLVPGAFVNAEVRGRAVSNRILVPRGAVRGGRILVAESGVVRERSVSVDRVIGDRAVVAGDIRDGEHVIVSHLSQLEDGSPVRPVTASSAPSPSHLQSPGDGSDVSP
jgi:multidrug resistance efflux pump